MIWGPVGVGRVGGVTSTQQRQRSRPRPSGQSVVRSIASINREADPKAGISSSLELQLEQSVLQLAATVFQ